MVDYVQLKQLTDAIFKDFHIRGRTLVSSHGSEIRCKTQRMWVKRGCKSTAWVSTGAIQFETTQQELHTLTCCVKGDETF
jgi:hypothetical protein